MKVEVKVPAVGESVSEGTVAEWSKQNGDYVKRDEVLVSLETDKASVDIVAENDGALEIKAQEGETVSVGDVLGLIDIDAKPTATESKPEQSITTDTSAPKGNGKDNGSGSTHPGLQSHLSPATRRVVAEKGIDPGAVQGSGRGGRLTKADVENYQAPPVAVPLPQETKAPVSNVDRGERRVKMTTIRKRIAERLVQSQHTAAILTTFNEIDMSAVMQLRSQYKEKFKEKYGVGLGFMGFFVKACVEALKHIPEVNAFIDGEELVYHDYVNMGIAVGTEKGLMVPVLRDADLLSIAEIEAGIRGFALKARDGKISINDLSGGTFTISNGGVYGSLMSTPILNPPQSGILGMHKIEQRPVAEKGEIQIKPMMYVALSYDHRIVDGEGAVTFLVKIKECIEDPQRMLIGI